MRKMVTVLALFILHTSIFSAEPVFLKGTVKDADGTGIEGVGLALVNKADAAAATDAQGTFTIDIPVGITTPGMVRPSQPVLRLSGSRLVIGSLPSDVIVRIELFASDGRKVSDVQFNENKTRTLVAELPSLASGLHLMRLTIGQATITRSLLYLGKSDIHLSDSPARPIGMILSKQSTAPAVDTLVATKTGYVETRLPIDSYEKQGIEIVIQAEDGPIGEFPLVYGVENTGSDCPKPTLLDKVADYPAVANLPDPFLMADGTTRMTTKAQWKCRRAEINTMIQKFQLGPKPEMTSEDEVVASVSGGTLTVTVTHNGQSITLSSKMSIPSGTGPFPAIIALGMSSAPSSGSLPDVFSGNNIAKMGFDATQLAPQSDGTRGKGNFFKLYPDGTVGDYTAWAWGFSRIVDGIFMTAAETKIDTTKLAVTGCSWAGKGALMLGALDERIALTLPQESGGGGEASWRVMADNSGMEDLEHAQGVAWYAQSLKSVKNSMAKNCPWDNHELLALVAPRAVYVIGNPDMEYLGSKAGYISCLAAKEVWKALGVPDRMGFGYIGGHFHCTNVPEQNRSDLEKFVLKFLLDDQSVDTEDIAEYGGSTPGTDKYITWDTPELE